MKKTLNVVCPHCQLKAELKIDQEAEMILMRCVSCSGPYLYFHGETYEVNESEMDSLRKAELKEVEGLLRVDEEEEHHEFEDLPDFDEVQDQKVMTKPKPKAIVQKAEVSERDRCITHDEIVDLIIDLETSTDVNEFLAKIA